MADANASLVSNLFGISPEQIQAQKDALAQQQALQYASLDPIQQAQYSMYRAGTQAGNAVGGLLGTQDPQLAAMKTAHQLSSQFDISTPDGLKEYASALLEQGKATGNPQFSNFASMAIDRANALEKGGLENKKVMSEIYKNTADKIKQVGLTTDGKQVYQEGNTQYTLEPGGVRKEYNGALQTKTPTTNVTVAGEKAFSSKLGEKDAERVNDANKAADNSRTALKTLSQLEQQKDVISGTGASGRVGAANFLNTLGLIGSKDVSRLSSSEQYQKLAKDLVMQDLGGKLGAQISDADRKYVEARIPQLETSPLARQELITYLKNKHQDVITEANTMDLYGRKNNGLGGYSPKTVLTTPSSQSSSSSGLTLKEIDAKLRAAGFDPETGKPLAK